MLISWKYWWVLERKYFWIISGNHLFQMLHLTVALILNELWYHFKTWKTIFSKYFNSLGLYDALFYSVTSVKSKKKKMHGFFQHTEKWSVSKNKHNKITTILYISLYNSLIFCTYVMYLVLQLHSWVLRHKLFFLFLLHLCCFLAKLINVFLVHNNCFVDYRS